MPEQLIQWSPVKLKLDGIASFVIKGIEARYERKIKSYFYPGHWDWIILCLKNMLRDKMNRNVVFRAFFHLSLNYINLMQYTTYDQTSQHVRRFPCSWGRS